MKNGWTGGQYSFFRILFGFYLLIHFNQLIPYGGELFSRSGVLPDASASPFIKIFPNILGIWDSPLAVTLLLVLASLACLFFTVGSYDRAAALFLWYVWACLFGRNPLISNPSLPYVGWMLLAHGFIPSAPYGAWKALGRVDPAGDWKMPEGIYGVAWILLALGYSYSGYTKLVSPSWVNGTALERVFNNPLARPGFIHDLVLQCPHVILRLATWGALGLELSFTLLVLVSRLRPFAWLAMLVMHFSLMVFISFADLSLGMVMIHLFTFNPDWVKPLRAGRRDRLFYDGHCGLCHRTIRFVLAEDRSGKAFFFSPLQGEAFQKNVPDKDRVNLPDSLVVLTEEGKLLTRSTGVAYILKKMGGVWRIWGGILSFIPVRFRDFGYDFIARIRYKILKQPADVCPLMPPALRERFEV
jgi:predicted DCC family thiol-disulfide oxidoreductase YuxK